MISFIFSFAFDSIYIWSKTFDKVENKKIIDICKQNNIDEVIVSFKNKDKFQKFLLLSEKNGIKVDILIGNNFWIYEKNRRKIEKKLNYLSKFGDYNIHLDIEPHAIKSLKHHRKEYFKMYIKMLKYIHQNFPKFHISISIPTFYKLDWQKIQFVDKIYLMAYEYKNLSQLLRRVDRYKNLGNIVVVFNCKEFTSKEKLVNDVNFIKSYGYKNIAFHSLRTCMKVCK